MIKYVKRVPSPRQFPPATILFYDRKIKLKELAKFKYKIALNAGETLKNLESYIAVLNQVQKIVQTHALGGSDLTFIACGGGSVGDFVGFLASTYQRGKRLVLIPSTWLAVIDSAHGGKNGLNLNGVKNQIGTFYNPDQIIICEDILKKLPPAALNDAFAEALKIGIINRPNNFNHLKKSSADLFRQLPILIQGKYDVVKKDPFEKKGLRKLLNLGHTMGHVFESFHGLSHGQAIFLGMLFSLRFSLKRKYITWHSFEWIIEKLFVIESNITYQQALKIPIKVVRQTLMQDKKMSQQKIDFIFVKDLGRTFLKSVSVDDIISEFTRQQQEL